MFIIVILIEILLEFLWTLISVPLIRKITILKEFRPSVAALPMIKKDIAYLAVLSIMTYPMMLFMIL